MENEPPLLRVLGIAAAATVTMAVVVRSIGNDHSEVPTCPKGTLTHSRAATLLASLTAWSIMKRRALPRGNNENGRASFECVVAMIDRHLVDCTKKRQENGPMPCEIEIAERLKGENREKEEKG